MRIQHNIMAMNAYRNYTNNVSAMKANLEKLSSGYKINRAGDDAAGLAISEKMRAQITGLQTAQKNAKDGISLVQTAEGALTEVHDMLNRMVELATQSANGTYDNETDRAQLQKELNQLNSEINRIADSSNFNGIKLLDGSMAVTEAVAGSTTTSTVSVDGMDRIIQSVIEKGEKAYEVAGNKTVLDGAGAAATKAKFEIDLKTMDFKVKKGTTASYTAQVASGVNSVEVTVNGTKYKVKQGGNIADGETIELATIADASTAFKTGAKSLTVTVSISSTGTVSFATQGGTTAVTGVDYELKKNTNSITSGTTANKISITIKDKTFTTDISTSASKSSASIATTIADAVVAQGSTVTINGVEWTVTASNGKLSFEQKELPETADQARANFDVKISIDSADGNDNDKTLQIQLSDPKTNTAATSVTLTASASIKPGTYVSKAGVAAEDANKADTIFKITADDIKDGTQIALGDRTILLKVGDSQVKASEYSGATVVELDEGVDLNTALSQISKAIGAQVNMKILDKDGNEQQVAFQVGVSDGSKGFPTGLAVQRIDAPTKDGVKFDTLEKLAANFKMELNQTTVVEAKEAGKGLTLQIGDTPDEFNKLRVSIGDMHAAALGIADLDISTQEGASAAIDKIKNAINTVSDVRGTLGATQNRLDHTINNLSVMTENIQDAESTIRDTDVADEMMAYTKNNILIQSAQAMLAQANQVPQGVLQLLQ